MGGCCTRLHHAVLQRDIEGHSGLNRVSGRRECPPPSCAEALHLRKMVAAFGQDALLRTLALLSCLLSFVISCGGMERTFPRPAYARTPKVGRCPPHHGMYFRCDSLAPTVREAIVSDRVQFGSRLESSARGASRNMGEARSIMAKSSFVWASDARDKTCTASLRFRGLRASSFRVFGPGAPTQPGVY